MDPITEILSELVDLQELMKTSLAPAVKDASMAVVAHKVVSLDALDTKDALRLCNAVAAGVFSSDHKAMVQKAIETRLQKHVSPHMSKDKAPQQLLVHIANFLTAEDWGKLEIPNVPALRMLEVIADRYQKLGIKSLDEQTVKWAVATVLHFVKAHQGGVVPLYDVIYSWVGEFKRMVMHLKRPLFHDVIRKYPSTPAELPPHVFEAAYSAEDPPIMKAIPGLLQLASHVPLRSNSALLVRERTMRQAHQSFGLQLAAAPQFQHMTPLQARHALSAQYQQMHHEHQADPIPDMVFPMGSRYRNVQPLLPALPAVTGSPAMRSAGSADSLLAESPPSSIVPYAEVKQPAPIAPQFKLGTARVDNEQPEYPTATAVESAESLAYDESALVALLNRPVAKRPASADIVAEESEDANEDQYNDEDDDADGNGEETARYVEPKFVKKPAMETPAVAGGHALVLKRPASEMSMKVTKAKDVRVTLTKEEMAHTTVKNIASRWYHKVRLVHLKAGVKKEHAAIAGRKAFKQVSELWAIMEAQGALKKKKRV